ncbi:Protein-S-isoprenylcysteine O-methyltransferase [Mycena sanguinolenta]|uniref:Protein-S-isoprenylcysteine O-methyltransferase n=1 Tax=Mycena sanguinolenta TaxID=230812 RepID=A0A8H6YA52_9AGAR|nr:Protein-S-isoprenylcysteine O-methyltransferase [Mycena sanguinolenta]
MRDVLQTEELDIPAGIDVSIKSRLITVTGPRGTLSKNVRHVNMDIRLVKNANKNRVTLAVWQGGRKHVACLRTIRSLINNMIIGVTKGFQYKMRAVYAHFPINCIIQDSGRQVEIRNFLGEKTVRHVSMLEGVTVAESTAQKDELVIEGNDIDMVSQSAASIHGSCLVRNKDIRKFLDGIYVSGKGTIVQDEPNASERYLTVPSWPRTSLHRHSTPSCRPPPPKYNGRIPNTPFFASLISFLLGSLFGLGLLAALSGAFTLERPWWATYQLGFFFAAWAAFHWGEYAVTAGWNLEKCSVDSFLLENGSMYHIAHGTAVAEYVLTLYFRPAWKVHPYISLFGVTLVLLGQTLRSGAMIHASTNFSHAVAFRKRPSHVLVTDGIYAYLRHPSYAGFFYWALGTQLVLLNPVSFVLYSGAMWRFFFYRVKAEERALVAFFGEEYEKYRKRVGTWIPFVP